MGIFEAELLRKKRAVLGRLGWRRALHTDAELLGLMIENPDLFSGPIVEPRE